MTLRGDDRAVTVQIGAVLLFGCLIVAMSAYQVTVVPSETRAVEIDHNERVQTQLVDLRNAISQSAETGKGYPVSVTLGARYPPRTFFVNPPPASGTLRTADLGNVTITNATAEDEVGDYWTGAERTYSTRGIVYRPNYAEYERAPATVYEHSVVYDRFDGGANLAATDQRLVDGRRIDLVALGGTLSTTRTDTVTLDPRPVSAGTRTVAVTNGTGPLRLTLPTSLPEDVWRQLLAAELDEGVSRTPINSTFEGDGGTLPADWRGGPDVKLVSNESASNSGTHAVRFGGNDTGAINATLRTNESLDTTGVESVTVEFWAHEDGANANDVSEDLLVEYRAENGSWVTARTLRASDDPASVTYHGRVKITDEAAFHDAFGVRFRLPRVDNTNDRWYVDDVRLTTASSAQPDRYVTALDYDATTTPNTLTLTFESGVTYDLRTAKVGVGSADDGPNAGAAYLVPVTGSGSRVPAHGERRLVVEARDRYNSPVSGVTVRASGVPADRLSPTQARTDERGRAVFTYTAPDAVREETVVTSITDNSSAAERARFTVNPEGSPRVERLFADTFERADGDTVGNGWEETEEAATAAGIADDRLDFDPDDRATRPVVHHSFAERSSGTVTWTYTFNMERTGSESTYQVRMQLGDEATMRDPATNATAGTAVDLVWGGPNDGLADHEGFGYETAGGTAQIAVVSGDDGANAGGNVTVTVTADLDRNTYDVSVDGAGRIAGGGEASDVSFRRDADIDTVRIFMDSVNQNYFGDLEVDDVTVEHAE